ncbi:hypothetical protein [Nocardiopsis potens]|uniref:hypothetical protein n=1 Tax=Nocardiopsis potens TaxID=1246458 RepID=UPI000344E54B|nr:hypothetical protein [Nocardiopsis potens]
MRPFFKAAAPALALTLLLAGCSGGEDAREGSDAEGDRKASPGQPSTEDVIAEATFPYHEHKGEATFQINSLTVRGELMQLDYTITPGTPGSDAESDPEIWKVFDVSLTAPHIDLVDMENLRRYTVVEDENGDLLQPHPTTVLTYDEPNSFTAFFAAPRDGAEAFDVYLYGMQPIMDVPVGEER